MRRGLVIGGGIGVSLVLLFLFRSLEIWSQESGDVPVVRDREEETEIRGEEVAPLSRMITKSLFFEEYGSSKRTIEDDLEAVSLLLTDCQLLMKNFDALFLPDNQAITSFLMGRNPERIAWIPPDHASISGEGELLDRNGVPIFFHRESALGFQLRSAGEDRKLWTDDDVVHPLHD